MITDVAKRFQLIAQTSKAIGQIDSSLLDLKVSAPMYSDEPRLTRAHCPKISIRNIPAFDIWREDKEGVPCELNGTLQTREGSFLDLTARESSKLLRAVELSKGNVREKMLVLSQLTSGPTQSVSLELVLATDEIGIREISRRSGLLEHIGNNLVTAKRGISLSLGCERLGIPTAFSFGIYHDSLVPQEIAEQLWGRVAEYGMRVEFRGESYVLIDLAVIPSGAVGSADLSDEGKKINEKHNQLLEEGLENYEIIHTALESMEGYIEYVEHELPDEMWLPNPGDVIPPRTEFMLVCLVHSDYIK